ncbi:MAG TPA: hypothetical protein VGI73_07065 [Solirubrobacterales bacterium]
MSGAFYKPQRWTAGAGALALLLIAIFAGPARAATYPAGGSTFSSGLEGWRVTGNSCTVIGLPLLCTAESSYDASQGSPAGSLQTKTSYLLNAAALFKGEASFESPEFTADASGAGALSVQRAFADSDLVKLNPQLEYTVSLVDKTAGAATKAIAETVTAESAFLTKQGTAPLVAGHTYAIVIAATTSTGTAELGISGSATARFDNVSLTTGGGSAGGGGGGGNGGGSGEGNGISNKFSDAHLESLMRSSLTGSAAVKGRRVFVKAKCPAKVGAACKVRVQGLLKKGKPATAPRTAKIAKGKSKQLVLKIKPKLRAKLAKRRSLLFKETVKAAKAKATVFRTLKLIRR